LALQGADRAYQALQSTLSNPPGTAPSAAGIVRRIGTMLSDVRLTLRPTNPGPILPTYPGGGASAQQLLNQVAAARRATESLIQTLTSQAYQNYTYSVVLRDLDTLASRLAAVEQAIRSGTSGDRLQWKFRQWMTAHSACDRSSPAAGCRIRRGFIGRASKAA
jgi:hypothetical protein